jgi:hypothetical protein
VVSDTTSIASRSYPYAWSNTSTWQTFTDSAHFYSIRYPNLGSFYADATVSGAVVLGWQGVGDFDVEIRTLDLHGMSLKDWLLENQHVDVTNNQPEHSVTTTIDGMNGVVVFDPQVQRVSAYLQQNLASATLLHVLDFNSYDPAIPYPPFWDAMVNTIRSLPP